MHPLTPANIWLLSSVRMSTICTSLSVPALIGCGENTTTTTTKMSRSIATSLIRYTKVITTSRDALPHKRSQRSCCKTEDKWLIWSEFEPFGPKTFVKSGSAALLHHFSCIQVSLALKWKLAGGSLDLHTLFGHHDDGGGGDFISRMSSFLGSVHRWAAFIGVMRLRLQICIQLSGRTNVSMPLVANFNGFSSHKV